MGCDVWRPVGFRLVSLSRARSGMGCFFFVSELKLAALIQRRDRNLSVLDPVRGWEASGGFAG